MSTTLTLKKKKIEDVAKEQHNIKISLEDKLKPKLKAFFKNMNKQISNRYRYTRQIGSLNNFKDELTVILKNHYKETKVAFLKIEKKDISVANFIVDERISLKAPQQAGYILETSMKESNEELVDILGNYYTSGKTYTTDKIANELKTNLDKKIDGKIGLISIMETQEIAEFTKYTKGMDYAGFYDEFFQGVSPEKIQQKKTVYKTWVSSFDEAVRSTHKSANGQRKLIQEPFELEGGLLLYPGDTSLGIDMKEIYNCRCISISDLDLL